MYKELAHKTYSELFIQDSPYTTAADNEVLIKGTMKLIPEKALQTLYLYELKNLVYEKISLAEQQRFKYGEVLLANFEKIQKIYLLLDKLAKVPEIHPNEIRKTGIWNIDFDRVTRLKEFVKDYVRIEDFDKLVVLKTNDPLPEKILWAGSIALLVYFFDELKNRQLIKTNIALDSVLCENFYTHQNDVIKNVAQTRNNSKNTIEGAPNGHEDIDRILKSFMAL